MELKLHQIATFKGMNLRQRAQSLLTMVAGTCSIFLISHIGARLPSKSSEDVLFYVGAFGALAATIALALEVSLGVREAKRRSAVNILSLFTSRPRSPLPNLTPPQLKQLILVHRRVVKRAKTNSTDANGVVEAEMTEHQSSGSDKRMSLSEFMQSPFGEVI